MADPKISTFIIGMVWVSFIALVFGVFYSNLAGNYGVKDPQGNITQFDKMSELRSETEDYKKSALNQTGIMGIDIIGGYITRGYNTITLTFGSFDLFKSMTEKAIDQSGMSPGMASALKNAILLTVLIIIIIAIAVTAIMKWRL